MMSTTCKVNKRKVNMRYRYLYIALLLPFLLMACESAELGSPEDGAVLEAGAAAATPLKTEKTQGPVRLEVELDNAHPRLGDPITLTLTVEAEPDVSLIMPEFGDQLGRFGIVDFKPTERLLDDGKTLSVQRYTLDLPMSGKLRLPSFLVEFVDKREGSEQKGQIQEILSEELRFEVASVLLEGETLGELKPARPELGELQLPTENAQAWGWWLGAGAGLLLVMGLIVWRWRRKREDVQLPPDVLALAAIERLEAHEIPRDPEEVDAWYVELSGIIRHYIEGRFQLHAPRQTTEEFFEHVRDSSELQGMDQALLRGFLERADRVKFTDYLPSVEHSLESLENARQFVLQTRPNPDEARQEPSKTPSNEQAV